MRTPHVQTRSLPVNCDTHIEADTRSCGSKSQQSGFRPKLGRGRNGDLMDTAFSSTKEDKLRRLPCLRADVDLEGGVR